MKHILEEAGKLARETGEWLILRFGGIVKADQERSNARLTGQPARFVHFIEGGMTVKN